MRLFVAISPPAPAVAALTEAVRSLDLPSGRMEPSERWHVTLAFLGDVPPEHLNPLRRALGTPPARAAPLLLSLRGAGTFPRRGPPAVLWVGLGGDLPGLARLAGAVAAAVGAAGVRLDARPFQPHVTIARFRRARAGAADAAVAALREHVGPDFRVEGIKLVRSHLGPHPRYETVAQWPLSGEE